MSEYRVFSDSYENDEREVEFRSAKHWGDRSIAKARGNVVYELRVWRGSSCTVFECPTQGDIDVFAPGLMTKSVDETLGDACARVGITPMPDGTLSVDISKRRLTGPFSFDEVHAFVKAERERVLAELEEELAPDIMAAPEGLNISAGKFRKVLARMRGEDV